MGPRWVPDGSEYNENDLYPKLFQGLPRTQITSVLTLKPVRIIDRAGQQGFEPSRPTFSRHSAQKMPRGLQLQAPTGIYPKGRFLVIIYDPRAIVRLEGLSKKTKLSP
jgi:hypothetical protein